jgi:hypothetical protein
VKASILTYNDGGELVQKRVPVQARYCRNSKPQVVELELPRRLRPIPRGCFRSVHISAAELRAAPAREARHLGGARAGLALPDPHRDAERSPESMRFLNLSHDLKVPVDVATEAVAFIGARGSGKTHGAGRLAEELYIADVPFVWLDPVGVAYGLRLAKDGKGPGLSVPVFGGLHGDIPLEPTAGALLADLIVDKNLSAILDLSQFDTDAQKARFVSDFAERLFQRKKKEPSVLHLIVDEAQEFVPQNPQRGEEMMLHRMQRIVKIGRNFGIGVSFLSPRPQEISKKALNGCQTVLAFRLTGPQERKAMKDWIAAHDIDQSVIEKLPSLETGTCHVWSPAFLKVSQQIRILPKSTFDASATPKVGERRAARELAPIDLAKIKDEMAATIEKAKLDDPKALRDRKLHEMSDPAGGAIQVKLAGLKPRKSACSEGRRDARDPRAADRAPRGRGQAVGEGAGRHRQRHGLRHGGRARDAGASASPPRSSRRRRRLAASRAAPSWSTRARPRAGNTRPPRLRAPADWALAAIQQRILNALLFLEPMNGPVSSRRRSPSWPARRHPAPTSRTR